MIVSAHFYDPNCFSFWARDRKKPKGREKHNSFLWKHKTVKNKNNARSHAKIVLPLC